MEIKVINRKLKLLEGILDFPQEHLDEVIWDITIFPPKLKKEVKEYIINKLFRFFEVNNILYPRKWIKNMYLIGSIGTFQYKETSDIDVNFLVDYKVFREFNKVFINYSDEEIHKYLITLIAKINGENLRGTLHPLNYYLLPPDRIQVVSEVIYDIYNDVWIKFKIKDTDWKKVISYYEKYFPIALSWFQKIDLTFSELKRDIKDFNDLYNYFKKLKGEKKLRILDMLQKKKNEILADLRSLAKDYEIIRKEKKVKFEEMGEEAQYSLENILYKFLEKYNYLEVLRIIYNFVKKEELL